MVAIVLAAYLLGSIPFALIFARRWGAADLRRAGSGNLGAANVMRVSGVAAGVLVAALDMAKGAATACGVFSILTPLPVPPALGVFVITVWLTKYISLGSVLASLALPPLAYVVGSPMPAVLAAIAASIIIV